MPFRNTVDFLIDKRSLLYFVLNVYDMLVFLHFVVTKLLPNTAIHCFDCFRIFHRNVCRLDYNIIIFIRCCNFSVFCLCGDEKMLCIDIHCFDVLDSDVSKKVVGKVEKCYVYDTQAKMSFFCCGKVDFILSKQKRKKE